MGACISPLRLERAGRPGTTRAGGPACGGRGLVRGSPRPPPSRARPRAGADPARRAALDDLGRPVVADVGVERRRGGQGRLGVALRRLLVGLDPLHALGVQQPAGRGQQLDRVEQVAGDHRNPHVELELALRAGDRDRRVIADHLRSDLDRDLADHRVDLPGHDRGALLERRQAQLPEPGAGPGAHQRDVVGDLRHGDGDHLQRPRQLDQGVAASLRLEGVERLGDLKPRVLGELGAHPLRELRVRVEAGAGGGAAERDLTDAPQGGRAPSRCPA